MSSASHTKLRPFAIHFSNTHAVATWLFWLLTFSSSSLNNNASSGGSSLWVSALEPSAAPSARPSAAPVIPPDVTPSNLPTFTPSGDPTNYLRSDIYVFQQTLIRSNSAVDQQGKFNETQKAIFEEIIVNYTATFGNALFVTTVCEIKGQVVTTASAASRTSGYYNTTTTDESENGDAILPNGTVVIIDDMDSEMAGWRERSNDDIHWSRKRKLQDTPPAVTQNLELQYSITYSSREISVSGYRKLFEDQVNANLEDFAAILNNNNLLVQEAQKALWEIPSPSAAPSTSPAPTLNIKTSKFEFSQSLIRNTPDKLNATEQIAFEDIIQEYTAKYGQGPPVVTTIVEIQNQQLLSNTNTSFQLELDYSITYQSRKVNSSEYGVAFQSFMNNPDSIPTQQEIFESDLQAAGISVLVAGQVEIIVQTPTDRPTASPSLGDVAPSASPLMPSTMPSISPTQRLKVDKFQFRHTLYRPKDEITLDITQRVLFGEAVSDLTEMYGDEIGSPIINTTCLIDDSQAIGGRTQDEIELQLDYSIEYTSREVDTSEYNFAFRDYMNNATTRIDFNETLNELGIVTTEVDEVKIIVSQVPIPSSSPTVLASLNPTMSAFPTYLVEQKQFNLFSQTLERSGQFASALVVGDETQIFESIIEGMTSLYGSSADRATCDITSQQLTKTRRQLIGKNTHDIQNRAIQTGVILNEDESTEVTLEYTITWTSKANDLSDYGNRFRNYMNNEGGQDLLLKELNAQDVIVDSVTTTSLVLSTTALPTDLPSVAPSLSPSISPSINPTVSTRPTLSLRPTMRLSMHPSITPMLVPTQIDDVADDDNNDSDSSNDIVMIGVTAAAVTLVVGLLFIWACKKRRGGRKGIEAAANGNSSSSLAAQMIIETSAAQVVVAAAPATTYINQNKKGHRKKPSSSSHYSGIADSSSAASAGMNHSFSNVSDHDDLISANGGPPFSNNEQQQGAPSPIKIMDSPDHPTALTEIHDLNHNNNDLTYIREANESMLSQESLLSVGAIECTMTNDNSSYNNGIIGDGDRDEFDDFLDRNLEQMRDSVGDKIHGSDDMMSESLTKALMDDEEMQRSVDLLWGGHGGSMEVEASVLCDTYDWLKRNDRTGIDERRLFMQETMNKMVSGVRYSIIGPEDASRTIHGCATLLGLQLVDDLPETTIIITGMPKTIDKDILINVFKEYGEISDAAMASKARGFGLVRYRWSKSVNRVMETHRNDEIVVQDVAVTVRILRPDNKDNEV